VHALSLPRLQLGPTAAFGLVASIIGLALFASAVPSPLYGVYQEEWHFSTLVLTLVYGIYCFGVLAALLLVGRISDDVGRRPVLAVALVGLVGAAVLFSLADSVGWLFAARGLQGLTTGLALGAAGAALLDLHPRRDGQHAGLINGVASAAGLGAGALVSSVLVQYAPDPLVLPFLVLLGLFVVALLGTLALPEPVARAGRLELRPQRPGVPAAIRGPFALSGLSVLSSWSIAALYLSLGPRLAGDLLHTTNHLAGGAAVLALCVPAALTQLLWQGLDSRRAAAIGSAVLAAGMALTAGSLSTSSAVLFLGATAITGGGFGLAFLGALRSLTAVIPPDRRAEVMSAFYVVAYLSISLPAIAAGFAVPELGLEPTFRVFSVAVVVIALVVTVAAARTPARPR
jgi:predicted MFS family arabinose efflux permease